MRIEDETWIVAAATLAALALTLVLGLGVAAIASRPTPFVRAHFRLTEPQKLEASDPWSAPGDPRLDDDEPGDSDETLGPSPPTGRNDSKGAHGARPSRPAPASSCDPSDPMCGGL